MKAILKLENVTKVIDNKKLVENISFEVNKGEVFGFLGPNGAGKTTTIKMITGLYKIDKGEIYINGHSVKKDFEKALENVGGIIENPEMYGYLSGRDNLNIFARMHGGVSKERINEVIDMVKLGNRIDDKVKTYSLGMRQRLGVAQALLHKPKLLILDEPTNGLDPMGIKELRANLKELAEKEGISVLVSSHLLSEMELMCDRFIIIDGGKVVGVKSLSDIKKNKNTMTNTYSIEVRNVTAAVNIIRTLNPKIEIQIKEGLINIQCAKEEVAEINTQLVMNGIAVLQVAMVTKTLEDEFMEITEGSKGQIR